MAGRGSPHWGPGPSNLAPNRRPKPRIRKTVGLLTIRGLESQKDLIRIQGFETSVADPDPGSGAFLTLGSGMGKKSGSGSGMNNPDHIS
jgi:hypothetical protein